MESQEPSIDGRVADVLESRKPTRIAVFLRANSPFSSLQRDDVVPRACSTLGIDPSESRAKLMTVWKVQRLTIFTFDVWYDDYDWATAHRKVNLPVILVDYGKRLSCVKIRTYKCHAQ
ncbi:hypothetical protein MKZ38_001745 [Zalerion maritima]|uniref:Uncharacterized protein n=1 Tax=Zalerion maritima TaxID=339359 RepID=A0AAD5RRH2_9PEZI|nr:hypothetical protein MKZ38_001745 [Zalerion maritima]